MSSRKDRWQIVPLQTWLAEGAGDTVLEVDWHVTRLLLEEQNELFRPIKTRMMSGTYVHHNTMYGLIAVLECRDPAILVALSSVRWHGTVCRPNSARVVRFMFDSTTSSLSVQNGKLTLSDLTCIVRTAERLEPLTKS